MIVGENKFNMVCTGEVKIREFNLDEVIRRVNDFEQMDNRNKLQELSLIQPITEQKLTNVVTDSFVTMVAHNMNKDNASRYSVVSLGLGNKSSTVDHTDTALAGEVARVDLTTVSGGNDYLNTETYIGSGEANGETLRELALCTDNSSGYGYIINHAVYGGIDKTALNAITFEIKINVSVTS